MNYGLQGSASRTQLGSRPGGFRGTAVAIGVLILLGYVAYGLPTALIEAMLEAPNAIEGLAPNTSLLGILAASMLVNSAAVVAIGVLMFRVVRVHGEGAALGYLGTRIFESIVLAIGIVFLLLHIPLAHEAAAGSAGATTLGLLSTLLTDANGFAYQIAMIGLGVGSVPFWALIYRTRLVPGPLAALGMIGYAVFAVGAALEIGGLEVGLILSIPGGLFEVAVAIWLIARGFSAPVTSSARAGSQGIHSAALSSAA